MKSKIILIVLWILISLNQFCLCAQQVPTNFPIDTTIRAAIDFKLVGLDGKMISSENLKGNVVVLNFWGIYCKPCVQEIPDLNKMVNEFETNYVYFIGITGDSEKELNDFLKSHPFDYKICPTSDYKNLAIKFNDFPAVPIHFIINKDWKIVYRFIGKLDGENLIDFKQKIKELL